MNNQRRGERANDWRHREALKLDQERILSSAIDWYRETVRLFEADADSMTWDDLSDYERALYRSVEKYEQRKAGRR